jgi:hypothetical protein
MKQIIVIFILLINNLFNLLAQQCNNVPTNIPPLTGNVNALSPADSLQACSISGYATSDTIYFRVPDSVLNGNVILNSVIFDTIDLPAGLCWVTNRTNNTFNGGENGVIYISGTPTAPVGQYKVNFLVTATTSLGTYVMIDPQSYIPWWKYRLRIKCPGNVCTPMDNTQADSALSFIPYAPCSASPVATISPAGSDTICLGDSAMLTAPPGLGYSYLWSDVGHSTTQSILVSIGGTYSVTVYSGGDSAVSLPTVLTIAPYPADTLNMSGPSTFCQGGSITITPAQGNEYSYHWSTGATTSVLTVTITGSFDVSITNSYGCTTTSQTQVISVKPMPFDTITIAGSTLISQSESSYQWYLGGALLPGDTDITLLAPLNGAYSVLVEANNGCSTMSNSIYVISAGIDALPETPDFRIYPNPTCGSFTINLSNMGNISIKIFDALGLEVYVQTLDIAQQDEMLQINLGYAADGIYMVQVINNQGSENKTLVINR